MNKVADRSAFRARLALAVFLQIVSGTASASMCGDVDTSGSISATDALRVLSKAVGLEVDLQCPVLEVCSTTTTTHSKDECFEDADCVGDLDGSRCCGNECAECDANEHCPQDFVCSVCSCIPLP